MSGSIAVIGASGGIGKALVNALASDGTRRVYAFSRSKLSNVASNIVTHIIDIEHEESIRQAVASLPQHVTLDTILIATGLLHKDEMMPEKSIAELSYDNFAKLFSVNAIGPALIAKYFLPRLDTDRRTVLAAISARVGSISDNQLGGWYSYRASKAALNMIIKNLSIEYGRRHKQSIIVGVHPGTVNTNLSKPFQRNIPHKQVFTPEQSAHYVLQVIEKLTPEDSGKCFAWDGNEVYP